MDQELFEGLKKGRRWALEAVCQENLQRSWYLSCQLAGGTASGVPLLLAAWKETLGKVKEAKSSPEDSFETLLSQQMLELSTRGVQEDPAYSQWKVPQLPQNLQALEKEVSILPPSLRPVFWMCTYGGLSPDQAAQITQIPLETLESQLRKGEELLTRRHSRWTVAQRATYVRLSTLLRDLGGNGFSQVQVPNPLRELLWKEDGLPVRPPKERKRKPWTRRKLVSLAVGVGVAAIVIASITVALVLTL